MAKKERKDLTDEEILEHRFGGEIRSRLVFPRDPSEYPVLVGCNESMAIVATNRKTGYLMTRVVHGENVTIAKTEPEDIEVLEKKYPIAAGPWEWALEAIGKTMEDYLRASSG